MDEKKWTGLLLALTYGITVIPDPLNHVDDAFLGAIDHRRPHASPSEFLEAIRSALASTEDLSALLGLRHSDAVVREYLQLVEARLAPQVEGKSPPST